MERVILHADINSCYAQIEEMQYPELREVPMAVGGNEKQRHGIILAKNQMAKKYEIKTGDSLREAYQKCPDLVILPPDYPSYQYYTDKVKAIYREYSDQVESFGLDEAWVDITSSLTLFGTPRGIAETIQKRVYEELGLTISIGISFNKVFAKLGSDLIKPSGLVEIPKEKVKDIVYPLPVEDLLYVGRATKTKLNRWNIFTIGDLAHTPRSLMKEKLGKIGEYLWMFANGLDTSLVAGMDIQEDVKSCGNAITTCKDITNREEAKLVFYVLCESVASRMKDAGIKGYVVRIQLRSTKLTSITRQMKITCATNITSEIMNCVMTLLDQHYDFTLPLRTIGVSLAQLVKDDGREQLSLFVSEEAREKERRLDQVMEDIRDKFGFHCIRRTSLLQDPMLTNFDPKHDHTIYPTGFL